MNRGFKYTYIKNFLCKDGYIIFRLNKNDKYSIKKCNKYKKKNVNKYK